MKSIKGILLKEAKRMVKRPSFLPRKGDILVQILKAKQVLCMIYTTDNSNLVNSGQKGRKNGEVIKKPNCTVDVINT
jgi:hypothetical protein